MTEAQYQEERRYAFNERLARLGFFDTPPDGAHNLAVGEADSRISRR